MRDEWETSANKWETSPDEWETSADECRRVKTNGRPVQTNETLQSQTSISCNFTVFSDSEFSSSSLSIIITGESVHEKSEFAR